MTEKTISDLTFCRRKEKDLVKRVWSTRNRIYLVLDPSIVHRLGVDSNSSFAEKVNDSGLIELRHIRKNSDFNGVA
jgi:hypothetical protein